MQLLRFRRLLHLLLLVAIQANAGVKEDWERARTDNSAQALADFVSKYPNSKYSKQAEAALRLTRLNFAMSSRSFEALEVFVKLYPVGNDTERAKEQIQAIEREIATRAQLAASVPDTKQVVATTNPNVEPWFVMAGVVAAIALVLMITLRSSISDLLRRSAVAKAGSPNRQSGTRSAGAHISTITTEFLICAGVSLAAGSSIFAKYPQSTNGPGPFLTFFGIGLLMSIWRGDTVWKSLPLPWYAKALLFVAGGFSGIPALLLWDFFSSR